MANQVEFTQQDLCGWDLKDGADAELWTIPHAAALAFGASAVLWVVIIGGGAWLFA